MKLVYSINDEGVIFRLEHENDNIHLDQWPIIIPEKCPEFMNALHSILLLIDEEKAQVSDNGIRLDYPTLAELDPDQIASLGLPLLAPFTLHIEGKGLLTDADFRFEYRLINYQGRPVIDWDRKGVFINTGAQTFTLLNPFYKLINEMEKHNSLVTKTSDTSFKTLANIQSLLPKESSIDGYLREIRVADVKSFTIDIFPDKDGQPNARVIPVFIKDKSNTPREIDDAVNDYENIPPENEPILPEIFGQKFHEQFIGRSAVLEKYALGEWYVFLSPNIQRALSSVHNALRGTREQKISFLKNPHKAIRGTLPQDLSDEEISEVFIEPTEYGKRVAEIGLWQPKVLPFLRYSKEPWLPPEELGFIIDGHNIRVEFNDVGLLRKQVAQALRDNVPNVDYKGATIPATAEVLSSLDSFIGKAEPEKTGILPNQQVEIERPKVLLLGEKDNLNSLEFLIKNRPEIDVNYSIPENLKSALKDHQKAGLRWLQRHWAIGSSGALLADDMGLGKTLVCLCFLKWLYTYDPKSKNYLKPSLVIAPTALAENWEDEHRMHFHPPGIGSIFIARGTGLQKIKVDRNKAGKTGNQHHSDEASLDLKALSSHTLVISTYETVRDYSNSFGMINWLAVIMDEAQKIKNPAALVSEQCKAVASNAEFVLALTGTPVENRMADLWSLIDSCQPGRLGDLRSFCRKYEGDPNAVSEDLKELHIHICEKPNPIDNIGKQVKPILRRMKNQQLKGLPKKAVHSYPCKMPKVQADAYRMAVCDAQQSEQSKGNMLLAIHRLRSISLHPYNYPQSFGSGAKDNRYIASSARLATTIDILDDIKARNERVLLFIDSRDLQPILQGILQRRYDLEQPPLIINGSVNGEIRKQKVDRFQKGRGFGIIILSPRAAGIGLTLTSANHVIHLSRWWNPAVEDQCTDRVYRIGQERDVQVYLPMAVHPEYGEASFDLRLDKLLENKRNINQLVLAPTSLGNKEFEKFYSETITEICTESDFQAEFRELIKSMDGEQFEDWVLGCFKHRGFNVRRTPRTHDQGADAQAILKDRIPPLAFLIQCKQTQGNYPCDADAVKEILNSLSAYENPGIPWTPMVITNAIGFTKDAQECASQNSVQLLELSDLEILKDLSLKLPWDDEGLGKFNSITF